ncbi:uncharacterized protein EI97DRAFT_438757 [Westerdykella ornata]|uniref:Cora-domain-containing protein n=1 Tax=Westerdykella ornata TaxID=318751 RepID=A0A6A6JZV2_WESOR|nr:uncharacterized protein EI97DRAFT_438757 [Westerdykella ornata]KAF2281398.1 hypothetical protein EI97DRAFT_438757 [Westerdykella ornata]
MAQRESRPPMQMYVEVEVDALSSASRRSISSYHRPESPTSAEPNLNGQPDLQHTPNSSKSTDNARSTHGLLPVPGERNQQRAHNRSPEDSSRRGVRFEPIPQPEPEKRESGDRGFNSTWDINKEKNPAAESGPLADPEPEPTVEPVRSAQSSEASPLWYRTQFIPHRYGLSSRRDPLLRGPVRSKTLPPELPSRNVKVPDENFPKPVRRTTVVVPDHPQTVSASPVENSLLTRSPRGSARGSGEVAVTEQSKERSRQLNVVDDVAVSGGGKPDEQGARSTEPHVTSAPGIDHYVEVRSRSSPPPSNAVAIPRNSHDGRNAWVRRRRTGETDDTAIPQSRSSPGIFGTGYRSATVARKAKWRDNPPPPPPPPHLDTPIYSYGWLVKRLHRHMPHLVNVQGLDCREHSRGDIVCYDSLSLFSGGPPSLQDHISLQTDRDDTSLFERIHELKPYRARNVRYRYILVEDLSPRLIDHLGRTFWLNPEFFEEHLNRSGYRSDSYDDPMPSTWNTNATPKDYMSVRWFRPVHRTRIKPLSDVERDILLRRDKENSSSALNWISSTGDGNDHNSVRLKTNIFRKEWPIVSDPNQAKWETLNDASTFPAAWEERITVQVSETVGQPPVYCGNSNLCGVIILLDPLPTLELTIESLPRTKKSEVARSNLVPFFQAYSRAPIGPNLGLVDVFNGLPLSEGAIAMLGDNLASTNCTREDLTAWIKSVHDVRPGDVQMELTTGLLWIIHRDCIGFLSYVHKVLEEIGLHSTDDYLLQERLAHWRNLITRLQTELPAMRLSIRNFFEFLEQFQPLDQARGFIQRTLEEIDGLIDQNERSYAALRADMALLESKRGINQAESVGKLTELGFIFIPISCIASLFSMQVQPLSEPAPLYSFFVAAILTVGIIFGIRLALRSTALIEYKRETSRKIRLRTNLSPGAPIPTRTFILYVVRDRRLYLTIFRPLWGIGMEVFLVFSLFIVLMLPIIFLWVRNTGMDISFKSTLTILFFLFCGLALYPLAKARFDTSPKSLFNLSAKQQSNKARGRSPSPVRIDSPSLSTPSHEPDRQRTGIFRNVRSKLSKLRRKVTGTSPDIEASYYTDRSSSHANPTSRVEDWRNEVDDARRPSFRRTSSAQQNEEEVRPQTREINPEPEGAEFANSDDEGLFQRGAPTIPPLSPPPPPMGADRPIQLRYIDTEHPTPFGSEFHRNLGERDILPESYYRRPSRASSGSIGDTSLDPAAIPLPPSSVSIGKGSSQAEGSTASARSSGRSPS